MLDKEWKCLEQNLEKKNELLGKLHELCDKQSALLDADDMEAEAFDIYMDKQDELLQELIALDKETENIYTSLQSEKMSQDSTNATKIDYLKNLTSQIVEKSHSLQEKEAIKKQKLDAYFESVRRNLGVGRKSSRAALDYYKSMNHSNIIPPQFMDQKK